MFSFTGESFLIVTSLKLMIGRTEDVAAAAVALKILEDVSSFATTEE